ncbi:MAG: thioredoxin [Bacilli bacterium]|nr:thioredoxin [Bacilli bacterium]
MSKKINGEEFKSDVLESRGFVFVDFYADWCGPCKMLGPIMDEIANDNVVYKINVDEESEIASDYGIMSIPCVILFKDGKEYKRSIGLKNKEEILELMN